MPLYAPFDQAIFSQTLFGVPPGATTSSTLTVNPSGYGSLLVSWTLPGGSWNELILVRSSFGLPVSIYDGVVLVDYLTQATPQQVLPNFFIDQSLKPGHFYYYSLFVFSTAVDAYVLAGGEQGLAISDWGFAQTFQNFLPEWYFELDAQIGTQALSSSQLVQLLPSLQGQGPLVRFLSLLGFEMDWIRSEIESLFLMTSGSLVSGALLPELSANFGMIYEPELGQTRSRVLAQNAVHLYQTRGTLIGISAAATAFTGYGCQATIGKNIAVQLDDGAFDRSGGHWISSGQSVVTSVPASSIPVTPVHTAYMPANNTNVGVITNPAGFSIGFITTVTGNQSSSPLTLGFPVTPLTTYVSSIYIQPDQQATPPNRQWVALINWYTSAGVPISSSQGTSTNEVSHTWVRVSVTAQAPATAAFAGVSFFTLSQLAAGEQHLIDAYQFEANTQATPGPSTWDPPRDIKINLLPVRQNLVPNPQGLAGSFGATVSNGTLTEVTSAPVAWPAKAINGFKVTPTSTSNVLLTFAGLPVNPQVAYTFSYYSMVAANAETNGLACQITWKNAAGATIGSTLTGPSFTEVNGQFVRVSYSDVISPLLAASATVSVDILTTVNSNAHYITALLFEPSSLVQIYFDANFASVYPNQDFVFEGAANESISDYYPGLLAKLSRLSSAMPDYVPIGATFSLVYGAQAFINVGEKG